MNSSYKRKFWFSTLTDLELFEYGIALLRENYGDVSRLEELVNLLNFIKDESKFISVATNTFRNNHVFFKKYTKDSFVYISQMNLKGTLLIYYPPITGIFSRDSVVCLYSLIYLNYTYCSNHPLTLEESKVIKFSNLVPYLTFFVEDYKNPNNVLPEYDKSYFKSMKKLYWENKDVDYLNDLLYKTLGMIWTLNGLSNNVLRTFLQAANYLAGANALKCGRDSISCEDVVIGYIVCINLMLSDVRPLVHELYDAEKWDNVKF